MKKIVAVLGLCLFVVVGMSVSAGALPFFGGDEDTKKQDDERIHAVLDLARQVEMYKEKAGHYPLVKAPQVKIVVSVIADKHEFKQKSVPYQDLEKEMRGVLGGAFVLPKDPDGRPYQYASDGQHYYVSTFLEQPRFFARAQGRKHHKMEISNLPVTRDKQYRIKDIQHFLKHGQDDPKLQEGFFKALMKKDFETAKQFLDQGANPSPLCDFHHLCQPLATAAMEEDLDTMRFLIKNGADLDGYNAYYDVALIYALSHKKVKAAELLVESGANVNLPNFFGVSPFIGVAHDNNLDLLELMIEKGADLNANYKPRNAKKDGGTMRPLDAALKGKHVETIAFLLKAGADPLLMKNGGKELATFAKEKGSKEIIALLPPPLKK